MALNAAEALVERLATQTFLSLWSFPNPLNANGKELCDVLVVCGDVVLLISVKEVQLRIPEGVGVAAAIPVDSPAAQRWYRGAIDESVKQLYGAERALERLPTVRPSGRGEPLSVPSANARRIFRVAVALGANGRLPISGRDFGKGYVHVLDERSVEAVLGELNTVTDLCEYLQAKEAHFAGGHLLRMAREEDLLAAFVHGGRHLPPRNLLVEEDSWIALQQKPEWAARKVADRPSYVWDRLIGLLSVDETPAAAATVGKRATPAITGGATSDGVSPPATKPLDDAAPSGDAFVTPVLERERVVRVMAQETRFARRVLGGGFSEFLLLARAGKVRSRAMISPSGVGYVFLGMDTGGAHAAREGRRAELAARCLVQRERMQDAAPDDAGEVVIGLATEQDGSRGYAFDAVFLQIPRDAWDNDFAEKAREAREELGFFAAPNLSRVQADEFPASS